MNNKKLSERLNHELDEMGVPTLMTERVQICSKLFKMPRFIAEALLHGVVTDSKFLKQVAAELEISVDWLIGESKNKTSH